MSYQDIAPTAARTFRRNRVKLVTVDRAEDLMDLVAASSAESTFLRFHTGMPELRPTMARRLAQTPSLGLRNWRGKLVAEARYARTGDREADVAILVSDKYQGRGLGLALLAVAFQQAAHEGFESLTADVLGSNDAVLNLMAKLAPVETIGYEDGSRTVRMPLTAVAAAA